MSPDEVTNEHVVQVCMTGTLFQGVRAWLEGRGLTIAAYPFADADSDDLPTFMVGVGPELLRRSQQDQPEPWA